MCIRRKERDLLAENKVKKKCNSFKYVEAIIRKIRTYDENIDTKIAMEERIT